MLSFLDFKKFIVIFKFVIITKFLRVREKESEKLWQIWAWETSQSNFHLSDQSGN